jgi:hypothetical protein
MQTLPQPASIVHGNGGMSLHILCPFLKSFFPQSSALLITRPSFISKLPRHLSH